MRLSTLPLETLLQPQGHACDCGRNHQVGLRFLRIGKGVIHTLPEALRTFGFSKPFIVCDQNTKRVAWEQAQSALDQNQIPYTLFTFEKQALEPDEHAVGALTMAFDRSCDVILAIGSGVINDCCKVLAHALAMKSIVVATAPSMDGYASNSSSMIQNGVKVSLYNACPVAIIADTSILATAPTRMLWAGLGDMLAKYISICEWRISHLVTGEYYCQNIADLVRTSLARIVKAAPQLMDRDPEAIAAVTEGLILSGVSMAFAEISRPASGLEHYFSHLWEMMALERHIPYDLHGIQVGVGTRLTFGIYERIKTLTPSRAHAEAFIRSFDSQKWEENTRRIFGSAADTVLATAKRERKNDPELHHQRLNNILAHWDDILAIIQEELPPYDNILALMKSIGMPICPADLDISQTDTRDAFVASRDIRDKFLTSTLLWDLGLLYSWEEL